MKIIPFKIRNDISSSLFVWRNKDSKTRTKFAKRVGNSTDAYFADLTDRIGKVVFEYGENLTETFAELYQSEYATLGEFLFKEYFMPKEVVQQIIGSRLDGEELFVILVNHYDTFGFEMMFDENRNYWLTQRINGILEAIK